MTQFNKCCFCVPLRKGCLIIGLLHMAWSIILSFASILNLVIMANFVATEDWYIDEAAVAGIVAVYAIILILVVALLAFSILLLVGINKERRGYVKAYMIYCLIFIVLYAITFIVRCATLPTDVDIIVVTALLLIFSAYFLFVIRSYWVTMGRNLVLSIDGA